MENQNDHNPLAVEIFNRHAAFYKERFMDVSRYAAALDAFVAQLPEKAELLELACGPGNVTRYLLDRKKNLTITATDLAPNMLEIAAETCPEAKLLLLDARKISELNSKYDAVIAAFIFPYFSKIETAQFLRDAKALLKPGGVLLLSTMEAEDKHSGWQVNSKGERCFQQFYNETELTQWLQEAGFNRSSSSRFPIPDSEYSQDLFILAS
jgi:cyclopropane fatty-acyl-phospholipid synthase-like methyltransferase